MNHIAEPHRTSIHRPRGPYLERGDPHQCGNDCPLWGTYEPLPDFPLLQAPDTLPVTWEDACKQLYLPIEKWQTRLLLLEPNAFRTRIVAKLMIVDVAHFAGAVLHYQQQKVQYTALSYCWGSSAFTRTMIINDIVYPITENLFAFFQRYRSGAVSLYLWIDAICINQLDLDEKGIQVGNMIAVYERAEKVLVWLGEEGRYTKLAVEYLRWVKTQERMWSSLKKGGLKFFVRHMSGCYPQIPQVLSGIKDLCARTWVRRIWVKQEIWAAKRIEVYCGSSYLTWDEYKHGPKIRLEPSHNAARSHRLSDLEPFLAKRNVAEKEALCLMHLQTRSDLEEVPQFMERSEAKNGIYLGLLRLLNKSIHCLYSQPHDMIYALLGMEVAQHRAARATTDPGASGFTVDYKISLEEMYCKLAKWIIFHGGADSLFATDGTFGRGGGLSLPSWTPDFRHSLRRQEYDPRSLATLWSTKDDGLYHEYFLWNYRMLNDGLSSATLRLEGYRFAEVMEEGNAVYSELKSRIRMGDASILLRPFLKPLKCRMMSWFEANKHCRKVFMMRETEWYVELYPFAGPLEAHSGDVVAIVGSIQAYVVLRGLSNGRFGFVGCAYLVHDIVNKEGFADLHNKLISLEENMLREGCSEIFELE